MVKNNFKEALGLALVVDNKVYTTTSKTRKRKKIPLSTLKQLLPSLEGSEEANLREIKKRLEWSKGDSKKKLILLVRDDSGLPEYDVFEFHWRIIRSKIIIELPILLRNLLFIPETFGTLRIESGKFTLLDYFTKEINDGIIIMTTSKYLNF